MQAASGGICVYGVNGSRGKDIIILNGNMIAQIAILTVLRDVIAIGVVGKYRNPQLRINDRTDLS